MLARARGGLCFELNGLFAALLRELGFGARLLPCRVFAGRERGHKGRPGFRRDANHAAIVVDVPADAAASSSSSSSRASSCARATPRASPPPSSATSYT